MRNFLGFLLAFSLVAGGAPAHSSVISAVTTVSPSQPTPTDPYTVSTILRGSVAKPCIANITITVAGRSQTRSGIRIHANQPAQVAFTFSLTGLASGTDLTPTVSWSGCGGGSSSAIAGGSTPPTIQQTATPALSVIKTLSGVAKPIVSPGDVVTYRLEYASTGTATAPATILTDVLPAGLVFDSATGGGTESGGTVTWNLGDLDPGDSNSVEVTARVAANASPGVIDNNARIRATGVNEFPSNTVSVTIDTAPNILLKKTINDDITQAAVLEAGRVITYRIRYDNLGGGDAANVVITDVLPAELIGTPVLGGGISNSFDPNTRTATWNLGTVVRKGGGVVTLTAQIDPALGVTDFENTVQASFTGGTSNVALAHITVQAEPYIQVQKRVQPTLAAPGDALTYLVLYSNTGSLTAQQPVIRDLVPAGLTPIPGTFTGNYDPGTRSIEWTLPDLAPGTKVHSLSYQATVDNGLGNTDLVNQVTVTASNLPSVLTATASAKVQIRQEPVLVPAKRLAPGSNTVVRDGERIVYTIRVANTGNEGTNNGLVITDNLPPGLNFISASAGGVESPAGVVTWNLADVPANDSSGTVTLEVQVDGSQLQDGDSISNAVSVEALDRFGRSYKENSPHSVVKYNAPPNVVLTKTANPDPNTPVFPGDIINYTVTADLQSIQGISDLLLFDQLPPELEFIKADDPAVTTTTTANGTNVLWPIAALTTGSRSVSLQARVKTGTALGRAIVNNAGAAFAGRLANPVQVTHHVSEAAVGLTKSRPADQNYVINGEEITYTLSYQNKGKIPLSGITLSDTLPEGLSLVDASPQPSSIMPGSQTVLTWNLAPLAAGKSNVVTVRARVDDTSAAPAGAVLTNQAEINSTEAQPATAQAGSVVRDAPLLWIEKTVNTDTAHPGDSVEFTIRYENRGKGEAQNVVLTDMFPSELAFYSASDQASPVSGMITWNLGSLAPGDSGSKTVRGTVPNGSYVPAIEVINRANLVSDKTSATASKKITLTELPAFTLQKSVDQVQASPGTSLLYKLTVTKTGGAATDVVVADLLPPFIRYVAGSSNLPISVQSDVTNGLIFWELGDMPEGSNSASITFNAQLEPVLDNNLVLTNRAAVASNEVNAILSNPVDTRIDSQPVLKITKSASATSLFSPPTAGAGTASTITYSLTVENTGDAVAKDVTISDTLPKQLIIDPTSTTANVVGQTASWTIPTLTKGKPATYTISARVADGVLQGTKLRNTASVQTSMPGVGGSSSSEIISTVRGAAVLELEKTSSSSSVKAGSEFKYSLTYRNVGTATSAPIVIEDQLPPEASFVSASDGGIDSGSGHVTWNLPALAPNQTGTVTVKVRVASVVPDNTPLRNIAQAWELGKAQNAVQATIVGQIPVVSSQPVLEIDKTVEAGGAKVETGTVNAGGKVLFDITFRNVGSDAARNVEITDTLPDGLTFVSASGSPQVNGQKVTWTLPVVAAQTNGNFIVTARANSTLADGKLLTNTASLVSSRQPLPITDSAAVSVQNAVLVLKKTADRASVTSGISATGAPGGQLVYTLEYENRGNSTAFNTEIVDMMPGDVSLISATPAPTSVTGRKVAWNIGALAPNSPAKIVLVVRAGDDLPDHTMLHNTASISSDTTPSTAATPVDTPVNSQPLLSIAKSSTVTQVTPGQTVAYDITVSNIGSDVARDVVIADELPQETSFVSATHGGSHSAGTVTWDIESAYGPIPPNSSVVLHVKALAASSIANGTPLLNRASVTGENGAGDRLPPDSDIFLLPVTSSPALIIEYSADRSVVQAGGAVLYSIRVRNTGNDIARDVRVSALLPPDAVPQSIDSFGAFIGNSATWTLGNLPPSGHIDLQYSALIGLGVTNGSLEGSVASILASNAATASAALETLVAAQPIFTLDKSAPNSVNAGEELTYTLDYFNKGNDTALSTVVQDTLPPNTSFVSASDGGQEVTPGSGIVRWNLGSVAALAGGRLLVTAKTEAGIPNGTVINNSAAITGSNFSDQTDHATTTERSHTELYVKISAGQDPVAAGAQETFTVTWGNSGNQDAANARVTATLPPDTSFASASGGGTFNGTDLVSWTIGSLPAGATRTETFTIDVRSPLLNGTVLKSVASIAADQGLPKSAAAPFMVSSTPVWVISKSASAATVDAGGQLTFTIVLQNLGNEAATGVVVTDNLPAGLQVLSADNGGTVDSSSNSVTWNLGTVAVGSQPITLNLRARMVAANTTLTNVALLSSNELPPVSVSASVDAGAAQPIPVLPWPALIALILLFIAIAGSQSRVHNRQYRQD